MRSNYFFLITFLLVSLLPNGGFCNQKYLEVKNFLGEWEIYKIVNPNDRVNGHTMKLLKDLIGKKIVLSENSVICEEGTFHKGGTFKANSYQIVTNNLFLINGEMEDLSKKDDRGTLYWYDLPGAFKDKIIKLVIKINSEEYRLEITNKGDLVSNSGDTFIYYKKIRTQSNHKKLL